MKAMLGFLAIAICAIQFASADAVWVGLDENSHYSGPAITPADLTGKVVLVDCWGFKCPPCRALLPRMEAIWKKYRSSEFILLGNHCQERQPNEVAKLVKQNKLTYPIYQHAGIANPPSNGGFLPFMYVVNHKGKVVYSGRDEQEAAKAIKKALGMIGMAPALYGDVELRKYKSLEQQLVLGKPVKHIVQRLDGDIKRGTSATATASMREQAKEAKQLLDAIEAAKEEVKEEIEAKKESSPAEALKLVKAFIASFPEDGADYKAELAELAEKAKASPAR